MKRFIVVIISLFIYIGPVQTPAFAFQSVTYPWPGNGVIVAVTLHYDTQSVTWHYRDGTQFTQVEVDFEAISRWITSRPGFDPGNGGS